MGRYIPWFGASFIAHALARGGLPQNFQILDADDQYRLIRRVHKNLDLDETQWPPKQSQWFINKNKDEGLRPQDPAAMDKILTKSCKKFIAPTKNYAIAVVWLILQNYYCGL